jgi:hypothetical protein
MIHQWLGASGWWLVKTGRGSHEGHEVRAKVLPKA